MKQHFSCYNLACNHTVTGDDAVQRLCVWYLHSVMNTCGQRRITQPQRQLAHKPDKPGIPTRCIL